METIMIENLPKRQMDLDMIYKGATLREASKMDLRDIAQRNKLAELQRDLNDLRNENAALENRVRELEEIKEMFIRFCRIGGNILDGVGRKRYLEICREVDSFIGN